MKGYNMRNKNKKSLYLWKKKLKMKLIKSKKNMI